MLYKPTVRPDFLADDNFASQYAELQAVIDNHKNSGNMPSFDGLNIYYEYFLAENPVGNIVIVHGLSEFIAKYYEMIIFFLNRRYNVFIFDLRGHGLSGRQVEDACVLHVNEFNDYVLDLEKFIDDVVLEISALPITIFSHSMGGAITGLYLQKFPNKITKAVFCAPMVCPYMYGFPRFITRAFAKSKCKKFGDAVPFATSKPFNPNPNFALSSDASYARFKLNLNRRIADVHYQTSQFSNRWMEQATRVQGLMLNRKKLKPVTTECLLISAGADRVVCEKPQKKFSKLLPSCKFVSIKGARHAIFDGTPNRISEFYSLLNDFIATNN